MLTKQRPEAPGAGAGPGYPTCPVVLLLLQLPWVPSKLSHTEGKVRELICGLRGGGGGEAVKVMAQQWW